MANIAIDVDDTLFSFTEEARQVLSVMIDEYRYADYAERLTNCLYAKWDQWRTPFELCGYTKDGDSLWLEVIARCHDDDVILSQTPFRDSVEICNELVDAGHELIYISNRVTEAKEATDQWLGQNGFPREPLKTELVICSGDKRPYLRRCQYMIDDRPKNVVEFVYDFKWAHDNQGWPGRERKAFVKVADYNGGLTDVPGLYLAHNWVGLRRYLVKEGLLSPRVDLLRRDPELSRFI